MLVKFSLCVLASEGHAGPTCLPGTLAACLGLTLRSMPVVEAMLAVTPDTRSKGRVTAETALRLRLAIMPGLGAASDSNLQHVPYFTRFMLAENLPTTMMFVKRCICLMHAQCSCLLGVYTQVQRSWGVHT